MGRTGSRRVLLRKGAGGMGGEGGAGRGVVGLLGSEILVMG